MTDPVFRLAGSDVIKQRGLRDRVYDRVLDVLLRSDTTPGMRLSIEAVARELGVSPTPVREALVQLERTGLVTREANKGYRVAPQLADDQLDALFDARLVLEGGAAALASAHEAALVPRLRAALAEHEAMTAVVRAASSAGELPVDLVRDYFAVDWNFHHLIFEGTHNPFLIDMSAGISTRVHRMRQTLQSGVSDADDAVREHRAIVDAFAEGPDAVALAMRIHIERVRERSRSDSVL